MSAGYKHNNVHHELRHYEPKHCKDQKEGNPDTDNESVSADSQYKPIKLTQQLNNVKSLSLSQNISWRNIISGVRLSIQEKLSQAKWKILNSLAVPRNQLL